MRFLIEKDAIIDPLSRVSSVIETGPTIPILAQVLIESTQQGGIRLWGSNIDIEASEQIDDVEVSAEGKFVCSAQMLLEYCRRQPNGSRLDFNQVETELIVENVDAKTTEHVPVSNGSAPEGQSFLDQYKNAWTESLLDANDFPYLSVGEGQWDLQFDLDRFALRSILKRTEHAMGQNEPRIYLNATLLEITSNNIRAVTTDGHRMAMSETFLDSEVGDSDLKHRAVLPRKTALELSKVLGSLTSRVTLRFKSTHIQVSTPSYSFTSKLLEGAFPDWRAAVPGNLELAFRANRSELANGLKLVGILGMSQKDANKNRLAASVIVDQGRLDIQADVVQKKVEHTMNVEQNFAQHRFQVNYRYLLDALEAVPECENVELYLRDSQSACQVKFPDDASTSFLVMLLKDG